VFACGGSDPVRDRNRDAERCVERDTGFGPIYVMMRAPGDA